jgi:hypothetical protein
MDSGIGYTSRHEFDVRTAGIRVRRALRPYRLFYPKTRIDADQELAISRPNPAQTTTDRHAERYTS